LEQMAFSSSLVYEQSACTAQHPLKLLWCLVLQETESVFLAPPCLFRVNLLWVISLSMKFRTCVPASYQLFWR
jgi:hypothetical protein